MRSHKVPAVCLAVILAVTASTAVACLPGCGREVALEYDPSPDAVVIEYLTGGGLAPQWIDNAANFTLYGDGRVIRKVKDDDHGRLEQGRLTPGEVDDLLSKIRSTGFFDLKEEYFNDKVMDAPSSDITVSLKGGEKKVHIYATEVKPFEETAGLLMSVPIADTADYVPETGYLFVRDWVNTTNEPVETTGEIYGLLPGAPQLIQAAEGNKPLRIDGDTFVKIKELEAGQKFAGIPVVIDGRLMRIYPVYEPSITDY